MPCFLPAGSSELAGGLAPGSDQSRVRGELLHGVEAIEVGDLVEDRHPENLADAGHGAQTIEGGEIISLGTGDELALEIADQAIDGVEQTAVGADRRAARSLGKTLRKSAAIRRVIEALLERLEIGLGLGHLEMGEELGAEADEVEPPAQQIAGGAKASRVDVGEWEVSTAQELGDFPGVELVALGLQAVNRAHAEGVTEDELDPLLFTQVGEPVPGEEALAADDEVAAAKWRQGVEQGIRSAREIAVQHRLAVAIEDADVHRPGVQIDATTELMATGVNSHAVPPLEGCWSTSKATAWVAPEEACMSFKSFERMRSAPAAALRAAGAVAHRLAQIRYAAT